MFQVPEVVLVRAVAAVRAAGGEGGQGRLQRRHQAHAREGGQEGPVAHHMDRLRQGCPSRDCVITDSGLN